MKRIIAVIAIVLMMFGMAYAGAIQQGTITASTTATGITSPNENAKRALLTVEGGSVYIGLYSSPSITSGHLLYAGDVMVLDNYHDISTFKAILTSAGSASTTTYVRYTLFD
jgi:hypothetical protein